MFWLTKWLAIYRNNRINDNLHTMDKCISVLEDKKREKKAGNSFNRKKIKYFNVITKLMLYHWKGFV